MSAASTRPIPGWVRRAGAARAATESAQSTPPPSPSAPPPPLEGVEDGRGGDASTRPQPPMGGEVARAKPVTERGAGATIASTSALPRIPSFRPDGSVMDLLDPKPSDIVLAELANGLSKIARFNGRYRDAAYSVAQHCVMGADALFRETGDAVPAGYFLLHDAHEAITGDIVRPMQEALEALLAPALIVLDDDASPVRAAVKTIQARIDVAVWSAAGLPPLERMPAYARAVAQMDERMLRAEALALFGRRAAPHLPAARLPAPRLAGAITPWGAAKAELAWLDRLDRYLGIAVR